MSRLLRWTISARAYLAAANDYDYCADESVVPASTRLSSSSSTILSSSSTATLVEEKEEEEEVIFPGFAMYQMAIAYYCQGQYSLALDTTTDILSYQKKKLVSLNNPNHNNDDGSGNYAKSTTLTIETAGTTTTTSSNFAKDLHNAVMTHVNSPRWMDKKEKKQQNHHPMLSNTIAVMISNYPTHHGVVKTLLLRGQILAANACGGTAMDDSSLILQAVCSIEMAVAIQRKIIAVATPLCTTTTTTTTTNDQLLVLVDALILLGIMKCQLRQYNESLIVYLEAFDILNDIRQQATKPDQQVALGNKEEKKNDNSEIDVAADDNYHNNAMIHHYQQAIMITHQIARLLYLQGKVYHRQYKFIEAFHYYNKSLNLLLQLQKKKKLNNKTTVSCSLRTQNDTSNSSFSIKTITKCTKSKYAFEKLLSAYWDDNCVI